MILKPVLAVAASAAVLTSGLALAVPAQATQGDFREEVTIREFRAIQPGILKKRAERILDGKGTKVTKKVREYPVAGNPDKKVLVKYKKPYRKGWNRVASKRFVTTTPPDVPAGPESVFDSTPGQLPDNLPSLGFQATRTNALGDRVQLAEGGRVLDSATVTMSSWACEDGHHGDGTCVTTPGATFDHPLTFTVYEVGADGVVGDEVASLTDVFAIPYRPSTTQECQDAGKTGWGEDCASGIAHNVTFDFSGQDVTLPDEFVYAVSFNTDTYGANPIGSAGPWSSLNVGLNTDPSAPSVGTDVNADVLYWDSTYGGRAAGLATDSGWTGYTPAVKINTEHRAI